MWLSLNQRFCFTVKCCFSLATSQRSLSSYEIVRPAKVRNVRREFPDSLQKPPYWKTGEIDLQVVKKVINRSPDLVRDARAIKGVRKACILAKHVLKSVQQFLKPGITGEEVDDLVYRECLRNNCYPSPLNFDGFPKCVTISTNNIVVHGIPDNRSFKEGDLVSIDISIYHNGYHGDTAASFLLDKRGTINLAYCNLNQLDLNAVRLIKVTKFCLEEAIRNCKDGVPISRIGEIVEQIADSNGFSVIPSVCGHSIGEYFHGPPDIVHAVSDDYEENERMIVTIEPALCEGKPDVEIYEDGWTMGTEDNSRSAQFEHTIVIGKNKSVILT